jgi:hypothetical protein
LHLSCVFGREIERGRPPRNLTGLDMSWHIIQNNTVACMPGLHSSWYSLSGHSKHIQKLTSSVLSFCPVWLAFRGFKILYNWPAVGWIDGKVVKRNVNRRMKIGSDIVNFFVFYQHDDDTSKHEILQQRGSSLCLGGKNKAWCGQGCKWAEFTWRLITYAWVIFDLHTSWHPPITFPLLALPIIINPRHTQ